MAFAMRLQLHAAAATHCARVDLGIASTAEDRLLPVQRQMVGELGHLHLREQARDGMPLSITWGATGAWTSFSHFAQAAHVALHREDARLVIQLLGDVFADALHPASAAAGGALRLVADLAPRQIGRKRLALCKLALSGGRVPRLQFLDLVGDSLKVSVQRFL
jgi:hypothetical protein